MPASTLPTRSPPTSAPLVKMPPPRPGEDRNQRGAEAERHHRVDDRAVVRAPDAALPVRKHEVKRDAEEREAGDQQTGDGAGPEGELKTAGERADGGLRGAHVGAHRHVHADEAGGAGKDGADRKTDGHEPAEEDTRQ